MQSTYIQSIFGDGLIRAFFWTLVHSLWQGLLLAILAGILILITRRSSPGLRYNLLSGLLCLFFLAAGTTFVLEWQAAKDAVREPATVSVTQSFSSGAILGTMVPDAGSVSTGTGDEQPWVSVVVSFFNRYAALIVTVWFIFFSGRMVKLLAEMVVVQRIRFRKTRSVSGHWQQRLMQLAGRLQIKKPVGLLESEVIRVPMMAGIFKPIILVPLGLLSRIPPQQVEAILLHELAHIRRKDYLVNILQRLIETLFFFNPAVLWVSSMIREEREHCCDDIAVGETHDKKEFIQALVSFQEYVQPESSYALAFPGSGNHLLGRIRRMVHNENKTLDLREKFFVIACLFVTGWLTLAFSHPSHARQEQAVAEVSIKDTSAPVTPEAKAEPVHPIGPIVPGAPVEGNASLASGKPIGSAVPSVPVEPVEPVNSGRPVEARMPAEIADTVIRPGKRRGPVKTDGDAPAKEEEEKYREQEKYLEEAQRRLQQEQEKLGVLQEQLARQQAQLAEQYVMSDRDKKSMQHAILDSLMSKDLLKFRDGDKLMKNKQFKAEIEKLKAEQKAMLMQNNVQLQHEMKLQRDMKFRFEGDTARAKKKALEFQYRFNYEQSKASRRSIDPVIEMLQEKKLITDTKDLSFSLDKNGLIVNGVKQQEDVYQDFKERFLHNPEDKVIYSRKGGSESMTVDKHD